MGTCSLKNTAPNSFDISVKDFHLKYVVGTGGFGEVWKVQRKRDSEIFAMKILSKAKILYKDSVHSVMSERRLLARLNHP